jgi:hypothetical protein
MITPSPPDPGKNPANIRLSMSICGNNAGTRKADPTIATATLDKEQEPLLSTVQGTVCTVKKRNSKMEKRINPFTTVVSCATTTLGPIFLRTVEQNSPPTPVLFIPLQYIALYT